MRRIIPAAAVLAVALSTAACEPGSTITTKADASSGSSAAVSSTAAAASPTTPKAAKVGDAITLEGNDAGEKVTVTLVQIVDNAQGADEYTKPDAGNRFVAVQFQIVNSGTAAYNDSPSNGAKAIDTAGQQFDPSFMNDTKAGPSLPAGTKIAPGGKALGFLTFELPTSSTLASVQFSMNSGFGSTGEWSVS